MFNCETARNGVARVLHQVATAMERTAELLRTQLNTSVLFVSPPGMLYWGSAFQQIVYMLSELCLASNIDFFICAPNLRVGQDDSGPAALSVHADLAAISRLLQTLERNDNAHLTWDDAINKICVWGVSRSMRKAAVFFPMQHRGSAKICADIVAWDVRPTPPR